jgi:hypothetical protein
LKKVAILQSNYIPWKGYFDLIASVDEFIIYDDMQFTKNDWRNRNKIKTPKGVEWLSVPVGQNIDRKIREVEIPDDRWQLKHWKTFMANYRGAPYYKPISEILEPFYLAKQHKNLSLLNKELIDLICSYLSIETKLKNSWDYKLVVGKTERLVDLCSKAMATKYISGPAAKDYLDVKMFKDAGIEVCWYDYSGYPVYPQLWGEFEHGVSILDLLFNCGPHSRKYMKISEN